MPLTRTGQIFVSSRTVHISESAVKSIVVRQHSPASNTGYNVVNYQAVWACEHVPCHQLFEMAREAFRTRTNSYGFTAEACCCSS